MYVPRALIIDGRDSFGTDWGSSGNGSIGSASSSSAATAAQHSAAASWNGEVSLFDISNHDAILAGGQHHQQHSDEQSASTVVDPLDNFHRASAVIGLSPQFSRFNADPPTSYNSGISNNNNSRHVQWNDYDEAEEDEEDDDDYCYGQDRQPLQEERRRQLERQNEEMSNNLSSQMTTAFEEAFYGQTSQQSHSSNETDVSASTTAAMSTNNSKSLERIINWHDYFMPPRPHPSKYQVALPFDTTGPSSSTANNNISSARNNNIDLWSSSFAYGYGSGGGGYISQSWRENNLSEALRKVLEGCDVVKGFNLMVDGGNYSGTDNMNDNNSSVATSSEYKYAKQLRQIVAGGGFYGGMATSLLEELQEECRSAGRLSILVDPIITANNQNDIINGMSSANEITQVETFRRCLNAGLVLHGLSTNSDAILPVSIDGAHRALFGEDRSTSLSQNRKMFEGSAAVAMALEASTLFYRLRRVDNPPSSGQYGRRSRVGIQSGFYQGYSGNTAYDDDANDPFASASNLTYHEFLACARPSSDRRRSVLELDALVKPLSRPSKQGGGAANNGVGDIASLLARGGGGMSQELLQLSLAGIIGGNSGGGSLGELHERMMRGTTIEEMRLEQDRSSRRSRGYSSSSRSKGPGEWMEDISTNAGGGGGVLSSLSGNEIAFGRRTDHHHFALLASLRPSASESRRYNSTTFSTGGSPDVTSAYLRPIMESMGMKYRPEVSSGLVVRDSVEQLTGMSSYWGSVFAERLPSTADASTSVSAVAAGKDSATKQQLNETSALSPTDVAHNTPILSILGNSTRSYPRLHSISTGFVDALHSRSNKGYFSRDAMIGFIPEKDDCEEALEYCRELVDVYEPPMGSRLVVGEDENDDIDAYFDENA